VVFRTEPIPFAVREPMVDLGVVERLGWGVTLWLRTDDAQALHDALRDAGFQIAETPFDGPFGMAFTSFDPDGYKVTNPRS